MKVVTNTEFLQNVDHIFPEKCVHKKRNCPNRDHCLIFVLCFQLFSTPAPGFLAALVFGVPDHYIYSADFCAGTPACQQTSAPAAIVSSMVVMRQSFPVSSRALSSMPWDSSPAIFLGARFTMAMTRFPTSFSGSG